MKYEYLYRYRRNENEKWQTSYQFYEDDEFFEKHFDELCLGLFEGGVFQLQYEILLWSKTVKKKEKKMETNAEYWKGVKPSNQFGRDLAKMRGEIMLHFGNGGEIEYLDSTSDYWIDAKFPRFDWETTEYRIKKEIFPITLYYYDEQAREDDKAELSKKEFMGDEKGRFGQAINLRHNGVEL